MPLKTIHFSLFTRSASVFLAFVLASSSLFAQKSSPFGTKGPVTASHTNPLTVSAKIDQPVLSQSDQAVIAIVLDFAEHWHAWPSESQDVLPEDVASFAIRSTIDLEDQPAWIKAVGPVQWPTPKPAPVPDVMNPGKTIEVPVYQGHSIAYIPILIADDAPAGEYSLTVSVGYQSCNETMCLPPDDATASVAVTIVEGATAGSTTPSDPDFANFDASAFATLASSGSMGNQSTGASGSAADIARPTFFGFTMPRAEGPLGITLVALLAAVGGFILNLTPCVLPVIPIKVLTISQHAGSPGKSMYLGLWMALGVVAFWLGIGIPVAFISKITDPSQIFGVWWITLGIGILIAAMGVGIMGVFNIKLPQKVYAVNPKADTATGSFLFGVMTAVLGLPCFGFVAGALLAGLAALPPLVVMAIFTSIGIGMAAPYLILAAKPALVQKIPRTGPASELVKQVMGLLLLSASAYFLGAGVIGWLSEHPNIGANVPWWGKVTHWWLVAIFALASGGWLAIRTFTITRRFSCRAVFSLIGLLIAGSAVLFAADQTNKAKHNFWQPFSPDALADAQETGSVVVVDFTAEWCLNCKALKATVLNRNPVKGELLKLDVTPLVADLTSQKAPGWKKLRDLGQTGIPLLAIYGPGLDEPWLSNAYTPSQVLEALSRARGEKDAS